MERDDDGGTDIVVLDEDLPQTGLDERRPDRWQQIGEPLWRGLKTSIVKAAAVGAIAAPTAERLIARFRLKGL